MNEDLRTWLEKHDAVELWNQPLNDGNIGMFHIGGRTFLIRFYTGSDGENRGWEVYPNLDPEDHLTVDKTLSALSDYCFPGRRFMVSVPTKPIKP